MVSFFSEMKSTQRINVLYDNVSVSFRAFLLLPTAVLDPAVELDSVRRALSVASMLAVPARASALENKQSHSLILIVLLKRFDL